MSSEEGRRKLAAILAADVVGYSRLMAADDRGTVAALKQAREVFRERIEARSGRLIDTAGDSVLAEFPSVVEAVECAVAVQERLAEINDPIPEDRRMLFRIGVNQGDVIEEADGTVYGGGVNVAARLEGLAEPGTIAVSARVYDDVEDRLDVGFVDIGEHDVKNIAKPVRAYRVLPAGEAAPAPAKRQGRFLPWRTAAVATVVILAFVFWQTFGQQTSETEPEPADPILAMPTGPSIAVLPFDNFSNDETDGYFADGLTEELITGLSRYQSLRVIARHSTLQYRGQGVDVRDVGKDLGVQFVLEGSVRRAGGNMRVTAQLLDAESGGHLWSQTFDRALSVDNIIAVQDELTAAIVDIIGGVYGVISRSEVSKSRGKPPNNLSAYECVLRAYEFLEVLTQEAHAENRDCLEQAVELEPDYVDAWAWLAGRYIEELNFQFNPRPDPVERALEAAERAVAIDATSQVAHHMHAYVLFFAREIERFRSEAELAISLNPNNSLVLADLGILIGHAGDWERGVALVEKAMALNPHHPVWYYHAPAMAEYLSGNYEEALKFAVLGEMDGIYWSYMFIAAAHAHLGNQNQAADAIAKLLKIYPGFPDNAEADLAVFMYPNPNDIVQWMEGLEKAGLFDEPEAPSRPVIAVLPFDNLSGDPEQEYFADGITEDIITRLAQYPDILVLGRNTTFQFKGQAVDIPAIAEKLGADYVVEGSIRRGGETVRVTAQLLGGDEWGHLWAETFDRELDPTILFAVQDEITEKIASRIGDPYGELSRAEYQRSNRTAPMSLSTYDCVLRYFEYLRVLTSENHKISRDCLESALEAEPTYGEALAYLADLYLDEVGVGYNPTTEGAVALALEYSKRAVSSNATNGQIRIRLARALYMTDNSRRARMEAEEALRLAPNNADVMTMAADVFAGIGAYERTTDMVNGVTVLNPNYPPWLNWKIAHVHFAREEYADAIDRLGMTQTDWWYWTSAAIASAHCAMGDLELGREALRTALEMNPDFSDVYWSELYFWHRGPDVRPWLDNLSTGLRACGWEVPPDPGPEAFAQ